MLTASVIIAGSISAAIIIGPLGYYLFLRVKVNALNMTIAGQKRWLSIARDNYRTWEDAAEKAKKNFFYYTDIGQQISDLIKKADAGKAAANKMAKDAAETARQAAHERRLSKLRSIADSTDNVHEARTANRIANYKETKWIKRQKRKSANQSRTK